MSRISTLKVLQAGASGSLPRETYGGFVGGAQPLQTSHPRDTP
jgi:hypothetical protein